MFDALKEITSRPAVFGRYTARALWTDAHRAEQMLAYHLNGSVDLSSRNTDFLDRSAAWIIGHFDLGPGKSVCDFGCGPGLYTSRLAGSGARVTGVDFSENSIRYARAQAAEAGQEIRYVHCDYLEADLPERFDLITLIMCDFCALSPGQRKTLLDRFRDCLKADGAILLDVYGMAAFAEREEASFFEKNQLNHFWCAEEYYCFVNTFKYPDDAVVLDKFSIFPEGGGAETVYNWLQYFSPEGLKEELAASGFAVRELCGDVAGRPYDAENAEFAVVAAQGG